MARPRTFDEASVVEAAIDCFWRRGFAATSVRDLAEEMGITGTSLYNAFGDKRTLFALALETYCEQATRARLDRLEAGYPPRRAIETFFSEIIERSVSDEDRRGCFLVNSALEVAPHDAELGQRIAGHLGEVAGFFRRSILAGQGDGTIAADIDAGETAELLLALLLGIRVLARSRPDETTLRGLVRPALSMLGPASAGEAHAGQRKRGATTVRRGRDVKVKTHKKSR